jgi:hypothetical protein
MIGTIVGVGNIPVPILIFCISSFFAKRGIDRLARIISSIVVASTIRPLRFGTNRTRVTGAAAGCCCCCCCCIPYPTAGGRPTRTTIRAIIVLVDGAPGAAPCGARRVVRTVVGFRHNGRVCAFRVYLGWLRVPQ